MGRFLLRRCLLAVPTVLGVVLVTFVLFHVVGGSPAAMVLGQNAGAQALDEFDASKGYDKPLFFGNWGATRALGAFDAASAGTGECARWGAEPGKGVVLAEGETVAWPWVYAPVEGAEYRLALEFADGGRERVVFRGGEEPGWRAGPGGAVVERVRLEKATRGWWDSQLWHYAAQLARLDFGTSTSLNRPVAQLLKEGIGPSLALTIPILAVELATSLTLALWCAHRKGRWLDRSLVAVCVALMSVNYLVWIVVGQFVLAYKWGWFPVWGFESWKNLLLPILIGVATGLGTNVRFYRTVLLEEMNKDYVRTARAKGLSSGRILYGHVLRNAMGPVIVNVALALPYLYTGSLLLENFFGIPGLGYLSLNAIHSSDVEVVRAVVLVGALLFTAANVLADVALAWADPRVKLA
ncbi:MAG: ABC transporter permease [Kiritimatiellae bacterium]|nr:ABC transporter permease [Kiritimatiellia bacterium]